MFKNWNESAKHIPTCLQIILCKHCLLHIRGLSWHYLYWILTVPTLPITWPGELSFKNGVFSGGLSGANTKHPHLKTFKGQYLLVRIYSWEPLTHPIGINGSDLYQRKACLSPCLVRSEPILRSELWKQHAALRKGVLARAWAPRNPASESVRIISHTQFPSQLHSLKAWDFCLYTI